MRGWKTLPINWQSPIASLAVCVAATYSDLVMESVMIYCFLEEPEKVLLEIRNV